MLSIYRPALTFDDISSVRDMHKTNQADVTRQIDIYLRMNELTGETDALLDRHAKPMASAQELQIAIKAQAEQLIRVHEALQRLTLRCRLTGLPPFVDRAQVLLLAARAPRGGEDPGTQRERLQRYLDEMMSLGDHGLSTGIDTLLIAGDDIEAVRWEDIVIPRDVVQMAYPIGVLFRRCSEQGHKDMAALTRSFHQRWRRECKQADTLPALQQDLRNLCGAVQAAESAAMAENSPRLRSERGPWPGEKVVTLAPALQAPTDRQTRKQVLEKQIDIHKATLLALRHPRLDEGTPV